MQRNLDLPQPQPLLLLFLSMASSVAVTKVKQSSNKTEQLYPLLMMVTVGMSPVEELPIPEGLGDDDDEGGDEEEEDFSWKCRLLEFIQQYPEVFDKASLRYKKKNLREAAWEEIATAMDSDGI